MDAFLLSHYVRAIERLGLLMLSALIAANLAGIFLMEPSLRSTFTTGFVAALGAALASYIAAQGALGGLTAKGVYALMVLSIMLGVLSALIFIAAAHLDATAGA